jgi:hypothetical protein
VIAAEHFLRNYTSKTVAAAAAAEQGLLLLMLLLLSHAYLGPGGPRLWASASCCMARSAKHTATNFKDAMAPAISQTGSWEEFVSVCYSLAH